MFLEDSEPLSELHTQVAPRSLAACKREWVCVMTGFRGSLIRVLLAHRRLQPPNLVL